MELTLENLFHSLDLASSQEDPFKRETGENALKNWHNVPRFHEYLQQIYQNDTLPLTTRWLAIIYLKNRVKEVWRNSRGKQCPTEEEKQVIRQNIFNGIGETNRQLHAQNADLIAKIARADYPQYWPGLFDSMISILNDIAAAGDSGGDGATTNRSNTGNTVALYNMLTIMNHVLKELSTVRFGRARMQMQTHTTQLLRVVGQIYVSFTNQWTSSTSETFNLSQIEIGYLALKVSCRLLYDGYDYVNRSDEPCSFFQTIVSHLQAFLSALSNQQPPDLLVKHIYRIGKTLNRLLDRHGVAFILMPDSDVVVNVYLNEIEQRAQLFHAARQDGADDDDESDDGTAEVYSKIVRQGMELIKRLITIPMGKAKRGHKSETDKQEAQLARERVSEVLNQGALTKLSDLLVVWYFRMTSKDFESWRSDPEEYFIEQELQVSAWEFLLRPCAASLFSDLLSCYNEQLSDHVIEIINNTVVQGLSDSTGSNGSGTIGDSQQTLALDCVLQALQYGYAILFEKIDFNDIIAGLDSLANVQHTNEFNSNIIIRRILLVISTWVSAENLTLETRSCIYSLLVRALQKPDLVVELNAVDSLRYAVDVYDFKSHADAFLPFAESAIQGIFQLLNRVKTIDSKIILLKCVSIFVEQLGDKIGPYIPSILQILPPLWEDAEENSENRVMQGVILQTLTHVVEALGWSGGRNNSASIDECCVLAVPVLQTIIDPASPIHAYLFEDSLHLWRSLVEYSDRSETSQRLLLPLCNDLVALVEKSAETLADELVILEAYVVFGADYIGQTNLVEPLFNSFAKFVPIVTEDILSTIVRIIDLYTTLRPLQEYAQHLFDSGLFVSLASYILSEKASIANVNRALTIFARLAISDCHTFVQLLHRSSDGSDAVVDKWITKFDNMGHPRDRKLAGLGYAALVSAQYPYALAKLSRLLDIWSELLDEMNESSGDSEAYYGAAEAVSLEDATSADQRRRTEISQTIDPVHNVSLRESVRQALKPLEGHHVELPEPEARLFEELIK